MFMKKIKKEAYITAYVIVDMKKLWVDNIGQVYGDECNAERFNSVDDAKNALKKAENFCRHFKKKVGSKVVINKIIITEVLDI